MGPGDYQEQSVRDFVWVLTAAGFIIFIVGAALGAWIGGCPL